MSIAESPVAAKLAISTVADLVQQLGDIPLDRILAHPPMGTANEEDLLNCQLNCELVDGTLVVKAMGYTESVLAMILGHWINTYLDKKPLGACAGGDGLCKLLPGLTRAPDVSFMIRERLVQATDLTFAPGAPDLCVEVLSKSNTRREINRKIAEYFQHGARLVWVFDIRKQVAETYFNATDPTIVQPADQIDGRDVLPGFQFVLGDLFSAVEKRVAGLLPPENDMDQTSSSSPT